MINLLPDDTKKQLQAARTNTILIRYIMTVISAALFLGLVIFGAYYIMNNSKNIAESTITNVKTSNSSYSPTTTKSNTFVSDLSVAKKILAKEISYSNIITSLINALPTGVVLESPFSINSTNINTPITLKADAKLSSDEVSLKNNLQSSPTFSNYSLQSVNSNSDTSSDYPYVITFSITVNGAKR